MTITTAEMKRPELSGPSSLDELAELSVGELARVYREARPPAAMTALEGPLTGRMLAATGPLSHAMLHRLAARLARARLFPWLGKSFHAFDDRSGQGMNRLALLGERFRFELTFGTSALDSEPCVVLSYDLPDNPWPIRKVRDELRELRAGLFFGPAMLQTRTEPKLVLFFGVAL